jgi:hypothetical protein
LCAVLEECLAKEVDELRAMIEKGSQLVLLDMENSVDVYDYSRPVAAAELLRRYLLDQWPSREEERKLKEAKKAQPEVPSPSPSICSELFRSADVVPTQAKSPAKKAGEKRKRKGKEVTKEVDAMEVAHKENDREEEEQKVHWDSQLSIGEEEGSSSQQEESEEEEDQSEEDEDEEDQSEEEEEEEEEEDDDDEDEDEEEDSD